MPRPAIARPLWLSTLLVPGTIATGLTLRLTHFGLPQPIVKYGGSVLWAAMIFWIVSTLGPRLPIIWAALMAGAAAFAVEIFKLCHAPALDSFRLTLPGALLLGRIFSAWDMVACAIGIAAAALADRAIRSSLARRHWSRERRLIS
jgi:hypothetical protein